MFGENLFSHFLVIRWKAKGHNLFLKIISYLLSDIKILFLLENYDSSGWYVFLNFSLLGKCFYISRQLCISLLPLNPQVVFTFTELCKLCVSELLSEGTRLSPLPRCRCQRRIPSWVYSPLEPGVGQCEGSLLGVSPRGQILLLSSDLGVL